LHKLWQEKRGVQNIPKAKIIATIEALQKNGIEVVPVVGNAYAEDYEPDKGYDQSKPETSSDWTAKAPDPQGTQRGTMEEYFKDFVKALDSLNAHLDKEINNIAIDMEPHTYPHCDLRTTDNYKRMKAYCETRDRVVTLLNSKGYNLAVVFEPHMYGSYLNAQTGQETRVPQYQPFARGRTLYMPATKDANFTVDVLVNDAKRVAQTKGDIGVTAETAAHVSAGFKRGDLDQLPGYTQAVVNGLEGCNELCTHVDGDYDPNGEDLLRDMGAIDRKSQASKALTQFSARVAEFVKAPDKDEQQKVLESANAVIKPHVAFLREDRLNRVFVEQMISVSLSAKSEAVAVWAMEQLMPKRAGIANPYDLRKLKPVVLTSPHQPAAMKALDILGSDLYARNLEKLLKELQAELKQKTDADSKARLAKVDELLKKIAAMPAIQRPGPAEYTPERFIRVQVGTGFVEGIDEKVVKEDADAATSTAIMAGAKLGDKVPPLPYKLPYDRSDVEFKRVEHNMPEKNRNSARNAFYVVGANDDIEFTVELETKNAPSIPSTDDKSELIFVIRGVDEATAIELTRIFEGAKIFRDEESGARCVSIRVNPKWDRTSNTGIGKISIPKGVLQAGQYSYSLSFKNTEKSEESHFHSGGRELRRIARDITMQKMAGGEFGGIAVNPDSFDYLFEGYYWPNKKFPDAADRAKWFPIAEEMVISYADTAVDLELIYGAISNGAGSSLGAEALLLAKRAGFVEIEVRDKKTNNVIQNISAIKDLDDVKVTVVSTNIPVKFQVGRIEAAFVPLEQGKPEILDVEMISDDMAEMTVKVKNMGDNPNAEVLVEYHSTDQTGDKKGTADLTGLNGEVGRVKFTKKGEERIVKIRFKAPRNEDDKVDLKRVTGYVMVYHDNYDKYDTQEGALPDNQKKTFKFSFRSESVPDKIVHKDFTIKPVGPAAEFRNDGEPGEELRAVQLFEVEVKDNAPCDVRLEIDSTTFYQRTGLSIDESITVTIEKGDKNKKQIPVLVRKVVNKKDTDVSLVYPYAVVDVPHGLQSGDVTFDDKKTGKSLKTTTITDSPGDTTLLKEVVAKDKGQDIGTIKVPASEFSRAQLPDIAVVTVDYEGQDASGNTQDAAKSFNSYEAKTVVENGVTYYTFEIPFGEVPSIVDRTINKVKVTFKDKDSEICKKNRRGIVKEFKNVTITAHRPLSNLNRIDRDERSMNSRGLKPSKVTRREGSLVIVEQHTPNEVIVMGQKGEYAVGIRAAPSPKSAWEYLDALRELDKSGKESKVTILNGKKIQQQEFYEALNTEESARDPRQKAIYNLYSAYCIQTFWSEKVEISDATKTPTARVDVGVLPISPDIENPFIYEIDYLVYDYNKKDNVVETGSNNLFSTAPRLYYGKIESLTDNDGAKQYTGHLKRGARGYEELNSLEQDVLDMLEALLRRMISGMEGLPAGSVSLQNFPLYKQTKGDLLGARNQVNLRKGERPVFALSEEHLAMIRQSKARALVQFALANGLRDDKTRRILEEFSARQGLLPDKTRALDIGPAKTEAEEADKKPAKIQTQKLPEEGTIFVDNLSDDMPKSDLTDKEIEDLIDQEKTRRDMEKKRNEDAAGWALRIIGARNLDQFIESIIGSRIPLTFYGLVFEDVPRGDVWRNIFWDIRDVGPVTAYGAPAVFAESQLVRGIESFSASRDISVLGVEILLRKEGEEKYSVITPEQTGGCKFYNIPKGADVKFRIQVKNNNKTRSARVYASIPIAGLHPLEFERIKNNGNAAERTIDISEKPVDVVNGEIRTEKAATRVVEVFATKPDAHPESQSDKEFLLKPGQAQYLEAEVKGGLPIGLHPWLAQVIGHGDVGSQEARFGGYKNEDMIGFAYQVYVQRQSQTTGMDIKDILAKIENEGNESLAPDEKKFYEQHEKIKQICRAIDKKIENKEPLNEEEGGLYREIIGTASSLMDIYSDLSKGVEPSTPEAQELLALSGLKQEDVPILLNVGDSGAGFAEFDPISELVETAMESITGKYERIERDKKSKEKLTKNEKVLLNDPKAIEEQIRAIRAELQKKVQYDTLEAKERDLLEHAGINRRALADLTMAGRRVDAEDIKLTKVRNSEDGKIYDVYKGSIKLRPQAHDLPEGYYTLYLSVTNKDNQEESKETKQVVKISNVDDGQIQSGGIREISIPFTSRKSGDFVARAYLIPTWFEPEIKEGGKIPQDWIMAEAFSVGDPVNPDHIKTSVQHVMSTPDGNVVCLVKVKYSEEATTPIRVVALGIPQNELNGKKYAEAESPPMTLNPGDDEVIFPVFLSGLEGFTSVTFAIGAVDGESGIPVQAEGTGDLRLNIVYAGEMRPPEIFEVADGYKPPSTAKPERPKFALASDSKNKTTRELKARLIVSDEYNNHILTYETKDRKLVASDEPAEEIRKKYGPDVTQLRYDGKMVEIDFSGDFQEDFELEERIRLRYELLDEDGNVVVNYDSSRIFDMQPYLIVGRAAGTKLGFEITGEMKLDDEDKALIARARALNISEELISEIENSLKILSGMIETKGCWIHGKKGEEVKARYRQHLRESVINQVSLGHAVFSTQLEEDSDAGINLDRPRRENTPEFVIEGVAGALKRDIVEHGYEAMIDFINAMDLLEEEQERLGVDYEDDKFLQAAKDKGYEQARLDEIKKALDTFNGLKERSSYYDSRSRLQKQNEEQIATSRRVTAVITAKRAASCKEDVDEAVDSCFWWLAARLWATGGLFGTVLAASLAFYWRNRKRALRKIEEEDVERFSGAADPLRGIYGLPPTAPQITPPSQTPPSAGGMSHFAARVSLDQARAIQDGLRVQGKARLQEHEEIIVNLKAAATPQGTVCTLNGKPVTQDMRGFEVMLDAILDKLVPLLGRCGVAEKGSTTSSRKRSLRERIMKLARGRNNRTEGATINTLMGNLISRAAQGQGQLVIEPYEFDLENEETFDLFGDHNANGHMGFNMEYLQSLKSPRCAEALLIIGLFGHELLGHEAAPAGIDHQQIESALLETDVDTAMLSEFESDIMGALFADVNREMIPRLDFNQSPFAHSFLLRFHEARSEDADHSPYSKIIMAMDNVIGGRAMQDAFNLRAQWNSEGINGTNMFITELERRRDAGEISTEECDRRVAGMREKIAEMSIELERLQGMKPQHSPDQTEHLDIFGMNPQIAAINQGMLPRPVIPTGRTRYPWFRALKLMLEALAFFLIEREWAASMGLFRNQFGKSAGATVMKPFKTFITARADPSWWAYIFSVWGRWGHGHIRRHAKTYTAAGVLFRELSYQGRPHFWELLANLMDGDGNTDLMHTLSARRSVAQGFVGAGDHIGDSAFEGTAPTVPIRITGGYQLPPDSITALGAYGSDFVFYSSITLRAEFVVIRGGRIWFMQISDEFEGMKGGFYAMAAQLIEGYLVGAAPAPMPVEPGKDVMKSATELPVDVELGGFTHLSVPPNMIRVRNLDFDDFVNLPALAEQMEEERDVATVRKILSEMLRGRGNSMPERLERVDTLLRADGRMPEDNSQAAGLELNANWALTQVPLEHQMTTRLTDQLIESLLAANPPPKAMDHLGVTDLHTISSQEGRRLFALSFYIDGTDYANRVYRWLETPGNCTSNDFETVPIEIDAFDQDAIHHNMESDSMNSRIGNFHALAGLIPVVTTNNDSLSRVDLLMRVVQGANHIHQFGAMWERTCTRESQRHIDTNREQTGQRVAQSLRHYGPPRHVYVTGSGAQVVNSASRIFDGIVGGNFQEDLRAIGLGLGGELHEHLDIFGHCCDLVDTENENQRFHPVAWINNQRRSAPLSISPDSVENFIQQARFLDRIVDEMGVRDLDYFLDEAFERGLQNQNTDFSTDHLYTPHFENVRERFGGAMSRGKEAAMERVDDNRETTRMAQTARAPYHTVVIEGPQGATEVAQIVPQSLGYYHEPTAREIGVTRFIRGLTGEVDITTHTTFFGLLKVVQQSTGAWYRPREVEAIVNELVRYREAMVQNALGKPRKRRDNLAAAMGRIGENGRMKVLAARPEEEGWPS